MRLAIAKKAAARRPPVLSAAEDEPEAKRSRGAAPSPPADAGVRAQVERTASFVARNGAAFEERTRARTGCDPLFAFLHDVECEEHAWYQHRLAQLRAELSPPAGAEELGDAAAGEAEPRPAEAPPRDALQEAERWAQRAAADAASRPHQYAEELAPLHAAPQAGDGQPLAADNRGHALLSRMGWSEGAGLGAAGGGRKEPVAAASAVSRAGLGAASAAADDAFAAFQARKATQFRNGELWRRDDRHLA